MMQSNMKVKVVKSVSLLMSVVLGLGLAVQGQTEMGVGLIAAALSSAGLNSIQGD